MMSHNMVMLAQKIAAGGTPTYAFTETFEGSQADSQSEVGYDNASWTSSSTSNTPRYATSPAPLAGTYSWLSTTNGILSRTLTAADAFHGYYMLNIGTKADNTIIMQLRNGTTNLFNIVTRATNVFRIGHGTINSANGTAPLVQGTTRHFWFDWAKGTGANGTAAIYSSADATKPGSPDISITNGDATLQVDTIRFLGGTVSIMDNFVYDTTQAIGSNPVP